MEPYDCIVVGAGYAGLAAAKKLKDANKTVLVLEARDRVGGRVKTQRYEDDVYVDCGGSYLGVSQPRMYALAEEYGVETFDAHTPGSLVMHYRNKRSTYKGLVPPLAAWELIDTHFLIRKFEKMATKMNVEEPWKSPDADALDQLTLQEWVKRHTWTQATRDLMTLAAQVVWGVQPAELSMLHALFFAKAGVSLETICTSNNGGQHQLMKGGGQTIANKIHEYLGHEQVHLGEAVLKIEQGTEEGDDSGNVTVMTAKGSYQGRHVIVAAPPPQVLRLEFDPPLPTPRRILLEHCPMGSYWKYLACYKTAFWRDKGLSGEVTCLDGLVGVVFDASPKHGKYAVLMAFVVGKNARQIGSQSKEQREKAVLKQLVQFHGPEAGSPFRLVEHTMMDEPYLGGCPAGVLAPGMWTTLGPWLRKPFLQVHWAGTETSTVWSGYMEGAVTSGYRAAEEVLAGQ